MVTSKTCDGCKQQKYDTTGKQVNDLDDDPYIVPMGPARMIGEDYRDTVCINANTCIPDFRFLVITEARALNPEIQGFFGMAPEDPSNGDSFVTMLYKNKVIAQNRIAVALKPNNTNTTNPPVSRVTIGGVNNEDYKDPIKKDFKWFKLVDNKIAP